MSEIELVESVAAEMVSDAYAVLSDLHDSAMRQGLTESGANEAVKIAITKLHTAMCEVENGK